MNASAIVAKAQTMAGPKGLGGVAVADRSRFIDRVANELPGISKSEVSETLLAAWSLTLETKGRAAAQNPNLARAVMEALSGHKKVQRGDGTMSPMGARFAQLGKRPEAVERAARAPQTASGNALIDETAAALTKLGSVEAVEQFQTASKADQDRVLLGINPKLDLGGHSGASFSFSIELAKTLLRDRGGG